VVDGQKATLFNVPDFTLAGGLEKWLSEWNGWCRQSH
jgi:hypothetical protein